MFSTETPLGPSCPCKPSALRTDEEADPVGLGEPQAPSFSIRDYVFTSRIDDIAKNWPFPQKLLQRCLNHGVGDPLPPFEPSSSVRDRCCRKEVISDRLVSCLEAKQLKSFETKDGVPFGEEPHNSNSSTSCLRSDELVVGCQDSALYQLSEKTQILSGDEKSNADAKTVLVETNRDQIQKISEFSCLIQATRIVEAAEHHPIPPQLGSACDPLDKKCRLVLKLTAVPETRHSEEIESTSTMASEPMISKVCPVCKIFASTSNTTLNAHIDQCLSAGCNINRAVTEIPVHKVKPKKKRLMVDIYATAARCTLEDLDKRNGTSWASEPALMIQNSEASTDTKSAKNSQIHTDTTKSMATRDDGNDRAVYVDSHGIKLRILSKSDDTPAAVSRAHFKLKKHADSIKEDGSLLTSNIKRSTLQHTKIMKVKPHIKKLSSFKWFKGEIQPVPEDDELAVANQEKEYSLSELSKAPDQIKSGGSVAIRHWVCAKRSNLPKKLNNRDIHNLQKSVMMTMEPLPENNQQDVGKSSAPQSHVLKFSRPLENLISHPKSKRVVFLSENDACVNPPAFDSKLPSESNSRSRLKRKTSKQLGSSISSSSSEREETDTLQNSDSEINPRDSRTGHSSAKGKRSSITTKTLMSGKPSPLMEGNRDDANGTLSTTTKFRKHRSMSGAGRQGELPQFVNRGICRSNRYSSANTAGNSKGAGTHLPDCVLNMDQESPSTSRTSEPEVGEDVRTTKNLKDSTLNCSYPRKELCDTDIATSEMHVESSTLLASVSKGSTEKSVGDSIDGDTNCDPPSHAKFYMTPYAAEDIRSFHGIEARVEQSPEDLHVQQELQFSDIAKNKVKTGFREGTYTCKLQSEAALVQLSSGCWSSLVDEVRRIPQENSSITSMKLTSDQELSPARDREPSGSPISTASTISRSPHDSEREILVKSAIQDKPSLARPYPVSTKADKGNVIDRSQEIEVFPLAKEPNCHLSADQPCCCSRRLNLRGESPLLRKSIMAEPITAKPISNFHVSPGITSSFGFYPSSTTNTMPIPLLESHSGTNVPDCAVKAQTCDDFGSPTPSPRTRTNSILRLMGKNLMVAGNEEEVQVPSLCHSAPENSTVHWSISPMFAANGRESFPYQHQLPCGSVVFGQDPSMVYQLMPAPSMQFRGLAGYPIVSHSSTLYNSESGVASHQHHQSHIYSSEANMSREVIVDNSPALVAESGRGALNSVNMPAIPSSYPMQQRSFFGFESQSQSLSRDVTSRLRLYPSASLGEYADTVQQGHNLGSLFPSVPRPLLFQSPSTGHLGPSLHYSHTLL